MDDCLFCKIIDRKISAEIVYESEDILAFNDINPQAPTHII
ncbi:MAG: HIT domain-containing protein, partial [Ignavibacteria bacterium]